MYTPERVVKVEGTPYEKGMQQGERVSELIANNVEAVRRSVAESKVSEARYLSVVEENLRYVESTEPDLVDEMRGISAGSKIDFMDIALINIPAYFLLDIIPSECSTFLACGEATLDHMTYLAKTRDMRIDVQQIVLERKESNGNFVIETNGAGILTYPGIGLNSRGLAVTTTGAWSKNIPVDMTDLARTHILINIHSILEKCATVDESLDYLRKARRMNGLNLLIADSMRAVAVEATRDKIVTEEISSGILVRTNHYVFQELKSLNPDPLEYPSTFYRHERISMFLNEKFGRIRFQEMLSIASDHENGENCVCRHGFGTNKGKTVSMSIIVLEDSQMWSSLRNPCESLCLSRGKGR
jgi:isopenicillin-N N-acyltransferase-like protein